MLKLIIKKFAVTTRINSVLSKKFETICETKKKDGHELISIWFKHNENFIPSSNHWVSDYQIQNRFSNSYVTRSFPVSNKFYQDFLGKAKQLNENRCSLLRYCIEKIVKEHEEQNVIGQNDASEAVMSNKLSTVEAAKILGIPKNAIYPLIRSKQLKATKLTLYNLNAWQITQEDLKDYQDTQVKLNELKATEKKEFHNIAHEIAERLGVTGMLILGTNKLENGNNVMSLYNLNFDQVGRLVLELGHHLIDISTNKEGN